MNSENFRFRDEQAVLGGRLNELPGDVKPGRQRQAELPAERPAPSVRRRGAREYRVLGRVGHDLHQKMEQGGAHPGHDSHHQSSEEGHPAAGKNNRDLK